MAATKRCGTCNGRFDTVNTDEYKCTLCGDIKDRDYYDTDASACKACYNGVIGADGASCTFCLGTLSLDKLSCNGCEDHTFFNSINTKCDICAGTVSEDKKSCTTCTTGNLFDYADSKTCIECIGTVSDDKLSCATCEANKNFDNTGKVC